MARLVPNENILIKYIRQNAFSGIYRNDKRLFIIHFKLAYGPDAFFRNTKQEIFSDLVESKLN